MLAYANLYALSYLMHIIPIYDYEDTSNLHTLDVFYIVIHQTDLHLPN